MSLRTRLTLIAAASGAALVLAVAIISWVLATDSLRSNSDTSLPQAALDMAERFGDPFALSLISQEAGIFQGSSMSAPPTGMRLQVLSADGEVVVDGGLPVHDQDIAAASIFSDTPLLRDQTVENSQFRLATASIEGGGAVQLARDLSALDSGLDDFLTRLMITGSIGILGAASVAWLTARSVTRPVVAVCEAAEQLAKLDDLPARINIARADELGRLGTSFNRVLDALETSRDQQDRLVGDASHELRTPLTSLRMKVELLQQDPDLPTGQRQFLLDDAAAELASLSELVTELVDLATSADSDQEPTELVVLRELVEDVVAQAKRRTSRHITVTGDGTVVNVKSRLVRRAISNLVSNAVKFTPPDTDIEIDVQEGQISVRDHGPGIPASDRNRVFDRFYRGPNTATTGHGIGLAIVASVAERHAGTVTIVDTPNGGTTVTLDLSATTC